MTESLQRAFEAAAQLPTADQDAIASWLLAEIESEKKWTASFSSSQPELEKLAKQALEEHARGETTDL